MALELWFDADRLPDLRRAVRAEAVTAGLSEDGAADVVLAVHELAANAVRHGGGAGRLRMHAAPGKLTCHIADDGPGPAAARGGRGRAVNATAVQGWLIQPGHGLWLVRDIADHLSIAASPAGSEVTAVFARPAPFRRSGQPLA
jgi:anti-sigma regulatory factor (Ser/Thr protein kinase)